MTTPQYLPELPNIHDYFKLENMKFMGDEALLADFTIKECHQNAMRNCHGGALAMVAECAAMANLRSQNGRIRTMKVSYMSPVKHSVTLRAQQASSTHTVVEFSGGNGITTTCHINWDQSPSSQKARL